MAFSLRSVFRVPVEGPLAGALNRASPGNQVLPDIRAAGLWTFSSTQRLYFGQGPVTMALNPSSVRHSRAKRLQKVDTMDGSTFTHFLNRRGRNDDLLKLEFRGNTGNIDLRGSVSTEDDLAAAAGVFGQRGTAADVQLNSQLDTGAMNKLVTFHRLKALSQEPIVFAAQSLETTESTELTTVQVENEFLIQYISPIYPSNVLLSGIFAQSVQFEENAESPFDVDYSFEFWVTQAYPSEDEFLQLLETVSPQALLRASQQI